VRHELPRQAKAAENLDGWQRALAEFQNYKKRVERDRASDQAIMKGDLIRKVLPVLDDLERALSNRPEDSAWSNGIELIQRKLMLILESEGVKRIDAEGARPKRMRNSRLRASGRIELYPTGLHAGSGDPPARSRLVVG
jgi:molecular chaperone GrpE